MRTGIMPVTTMPDWRSRGIFGALLVLPGGCRGCLAWMAYIERNPVRAGLVDQAEDYPWSSAAAHLMDRDESGFLDTASWRENYTRERWREALRTGVGDEALGEIIRQATLTGRPFGSQKFTEGLELATERRLRPLKAGRKKSGKEVTVTGFPDFVRSKHGARDHLQRLASGSRTADAEEQPQSRGG